MSENTKQDILDILIKNGENKLEQVDESTTLEEMGVDSLALVEIIYDLEEHFDITIPDPSEIEGLDSEFKTAGDVVKAVSQLIEQGAS